MDVTQPAEQDEDEGWDEDPIPIGEVLKVEHLHTLPGCGQTWRCETTLGAFKVWQDYDDPSPKVGWPLWGVSEDTGHFSVVGGDDYKLVAQPIWPNGDTFP